MRSPGEVPSLDVPEDAGIGPVLRLSNANLGYRGRTVLSGVDLAVRRGELWFILGPNGTGKTTLLRAILGVVPPIRGKLELAPALGGGRRIGFVPQRCEVRSTLPLTVEDFVRLGLTRTGIHRAEARRNVAWALGEVGLDGKARADYWSLSGGQRQRGLVARGLVRRPDLLILDEPTNGLDLPAEDSFLALLSRLNREHGITVLIVTHAVALAARFATHVGLVHGGRVTSGPVEAMLTPAALREAYGVDVDLPPVGGPRHPSRSEGPSGAPTRSPS